MGERYPVTVATTDSTPVFDPDNSRGSRLDEHPRLRQARAADRRQDHPHRGRAGDPDPPPRLHGQPARGVRRRGGDPAGRGARRRVGGAHARARRGRGAAARHDGDRHRPRHPPRHRRRRVGPAGHRGGDRRRDPRRRHRRSTCILFGNESADAGNYQVAIRVAHALGLPVVNGIKGDRRRRRHPALRAGGRRRPRRLRGPAARRGLGQGGHQPAALSVGARADAGQAQAAGARRAGRARSRGWRWCASCCPRARASRPRSSAAAPRRRRRVVEILTEIGVM